MSLMGYEADLFWPEAGLVAEFDGFETHGTRRAFHYDRRRDRALAAGGVQVVRVTRPDLEGDGAELASELRRILSVRARRVA